MKKALAAAVLAGGVVAATAGCGSHYTTVANSTYCVNEITGQVMAPQYCQVGAIGYNPGLYDYWVGPTYGNHYAVGVTIQRNYFVAGKQVSPTNSSARRAAGIPVTGSVSNGARSTTTTRTPTNSSTPAKPQTSPPSGSTSKPSTTTTKPSTTTTRPSTSTGGFSGSRSSSSSSSSSSRSSSSSSGRK
jgi:hypothetical protein